MRITAGNPVYGRADPGVNSDYAINRLLEYHLITEAGRLDAPGRPILFATTVDF